MKEWCDIQDQNGQWKVGLVVDREQSQGQNIVRVRIDGYHPAFDAYFCKHSNKMHPVRTFTVGFNTYPKQSFQKILRQPLNLQDLMLAHKRLSFIGRMQNLFQSTQQNIKIFMRTQLLVLVDKIIRSPFQLINSITMCDLEINKLFIGIINFYLKMLDSSKKYLLLIQTGNNIAKQLLISMYQFSIMVKIIIGSHKDSIRFFQNPTNLTIKAAGYIDCFVKADNGIMPFKSFFKSLKSVPFNKLSKKEIDAIFSTIQFFLDLCQRSQGKINQISVIQSIVSFIKAFTENSEINQNILQTKLQIVNRLKTQQLKFNSYKTFDNISYKQKQQKPRHNANIQDQNKKQQKWSKLHQSNQQIKELKSRVQKLQQLLGGFTHKKQNHQTNDQMTQQNLIIERTKNLGQQQFLASLNWALSCGDLQTCKKLVTWRQNLLQLGRIAGWQTALSVGIKTMKKAEITHEDIINANIELLQKNINITTKQVKKNKLGPLGEDFYASRKLNKIIQPQRDE